MKCELCREQAVLQVEVRRHFSLRRPPGPAGGWNESGSLAQMNSDMWQCLPTCGNVYLRPQTRGGNRSPVCQGPGSSNRGQGVTSPRHWRVGAAVRSSLCSVHQKQVAPGALVASNPGDCDAGFLGRGRLWKSEWRFSEFSD